MLFVSFKDFFAMSKENPDGKKYIGSSISVTHTFKQLESLAKTITPLSKSNRTVFGSRFPDGNIDLRFVSAKKMEKLKKSRAVGGLQSIDESFPLVSDVLKACQHDEYSTPLLLMTSSEMLRSSVWVDDDDVRYVPDLLRAIVSSIQIFENDVMRSDERKRRMHYKLIPAGAVSGVLSSADEICHRGSDRIFPDLDRENIKDRIQAYNLRVSSYGRMLDDMEKL